MSKLIRRIIKESIEEFDWIDVDDSGDTLYSVIKYLLEKQGGKYWMENDDGAIKLWDDTGYYFSIDEPDFTIEAIRESLHNSISNINLGDEIHEEYLELTKVLEPIIGSIVDERMEDLNESEEYDWIDTNPSNLSGQKLADMMTELFKIQNDIYWIENTDLGTIEIWDSGGYYLEYNPEDFTIDRVREDLSINIDNYHLDSHTRLEYSNLAKALEPIIGSINSKLNESEEFDWIDTGYVSNDPLPEPGLRQFVILFDNSNNYWKEDLLIHILQELHNRGYEANSQFVGKRNDINYIIDLVKKILKDNKPYFYIRYRRNDYFQLSYLDKDTIQELEDNFMDKTGQTFQEYGLYRM
jgi:hypothetical protein